MSQNILQSDLPAATGKVKCGKDQGTAFMVTDRLALTAFHVVMSHLLDGETITFTHNGKTQPCSIAVQDVERDVCLLHIEEPPSKILPLTAALKQLNQDYFIYGYPYVTGGAGLSLNGKLVQVLSSDNCDLLIGSLGMEGQYDYSGLSGSPILAGGNIVGIVLRQQDVQIAGISVQKIASSLRENGLNIEEEELLYSVPKEFEPDVRSATINYSVAAGIADALRKTGSWVLVHGSPGSGKSTLVASLKPPTKDIVICGHYFTKIPGDRQPAGLRTNLQFFLDTMEQLIAHVLTGDHLPKDNLNFGQRLQRLGGMFQDLGNFYEQKDQTGVLVIDGLDEVHNLNEFLGVLPRSLPPNFKIILSCTSPEILPPIFRASIQDDQVVEMHALSINQCEAFIQEQTKHLNLPLDIVQELTIKTEGHPLYMRYLVNYLLSTEFDSDASSLKAWVASIPVIGGDITRYYSSIWGNLSAVPDKLWIIMLLAYLRQGVTSRELGEMMPEPYKFSFLTHFPQVHYLLTAGEHLDFYHQSFREFAQGKADLQREFVNQQVLSWCQAHRDREYAVTNSLFHMLQCRPASEAVAFCDQQWADRCSIYDVIPELVLEDIRSTINHAVDQGLTVDIIRLLLLLERISFRYDVIFADQAGTLALALISMGNYPQAMRYLVREHTLLVGLDDANLFLQLFMENGALAQAKELFEAMGIKHRRMLKESIAESRGDIFDLLYHRGIALGVGLNLDPRANILEKMNMAMMLSGMADEAGKDGQLEAQDSINYLLKRINNTTQGYLNRAQGQYYPPSMLSAATKIPLGSRYTIDYALQIIAFRDFQSYNTPLVTNSTEFQALVGDTEELLGKYGFEDKYENCENIIRALMPHCSNPDLLLPLITAHNTAAQEVHSIRRKEGVEVDFAAVQRLLFDQSCKGYLDTMGAYPVIPGLEDWEAFIVALLRYAGFLEGRLHRLNATGQVGNAELEHLKILVRAFGFNFNARSRWERAYTIPESVIPILYERCIDLQTRFFPAETGWLTGVILNRCADQLGMYTEGFRDCLQRVIQALIESSTNKTHILPLINQLKSHVLIAVQNRRLRGPELLRIVEFYSLLGEMEPAKEVFQRMLDTSMGPDWYKEAQSDLLDTVLGINGDPSICLPFLNPFAAILDAASGEMTFQRYIRSSKESFAKEIIRNGQAALGMAYIQFELVPPPEVLIFNAEHYKVDMPRPGDGYILGARNIREPYTVCQLLELDMHPLIKFCLSSAFIINDDIDRFFPEYPEALSVPLQACHSQGLDITPLCEMIATLASEELMQPYLRSLLAIITANLDTEVLEILQTALEKSGVKIEQTLKETEEGTDLETGAAVDNAFDRFNQSCEKGNQSVEALLSQGFDAFTTEKIAIWYFNYNAPSKEAKRQLKGLIRNDADLWPHIKPHLNEYGISHWEVASSLIWFLHDVLAPEKVKAIYQVVEDHFKTMVRPEQPYFDKYAWLNQQWPMSSIDEAVAKFFIWLLAYPLEEIRERARAAIDLILQVERRLILELLLAELVTAQPGPVLQYIASLLCDFAEHQPAVLGNRLQEDEPLGLKLAAIQHFSVRYILLRMAEKLRDAGFPSLWERIESIIPSKVVSGASVAFEEPYLAPIQDKIDQLDAMELLNGDFCRSVIGMLEDLPKPLTHTALRKADKYLVRSFYQERPLSGRYHDLAHFVLNVAIIPRVDRSTADEVFQILNS